MRRLFSFLAVFLSLVACGKTPQPGQKKDDKLNITWDQTAKTMWKGGYGRVHRLADNRLMAVYEHGGKAWCKYSGDGAKTWYGETAVMDRVAIGSGVYATVVNSEFAQLSASNPFHPGRIIYAGNLRPGDQRSDLRPYSIVYATSDDRGDSWSGMKIAYESKIWDNPALKGCWEPFVLELPDGRVQIYFADETPYYLSGLGYQNISVVESDDGGDSWSEAKIVCYTEKRRDGMPVAMLYEGNIYVAIEHNEAGTHFFPQIVRDSIEDNWSHYVGGEDSRRFVPHKKNLDPVFNYYGAPYLIQTDNYFVLSYQSSEGALKPDTSDCVMEVVVCPKSEFKRSEFTTMRAASRPLNVDRSTTTVLWNSLCDLGGDKILAVCTTGGNIVVVPGTISGNK